MAKPPRFPPTPWGRIASCHKGIRITRRGGSSITYCARVLMRFCSPREGVYDVYVESWVPPSCYSNDTPKLGTSVLPFDLRGPFISLKRMGRTLNDKAACSSRTYTYLSRHSDANGFDNGRACFLRSWQWWTGSLGMVSLALVTK